MIFPLCRMLPDWLLTDLLFNKLNANIVLAATPLYEYRDPLNSLPGLIIGYLHSSTHLQTVEWITFFAYLQTEAKSKPVTNVEINPSYCLVIKKKGRWERSPQVIRKDTFRKSTGTCVALEGPKWQGRMEPPLSSILFWWHSYIRGSLVRREKPPWSRTTVQWAMASESCPRS